ncbi:MAG: ABC-2 transporter permease [Holophagaceae bacterium]|nr:ABC-2 transporter permease [Holophagaceae bacterium]
MLPLIRMAWTVNRRQALTLAPVLALVLALTVLKLAQGQSEKFLMGCLFSASLLGGLVAFQGLASDAEDFLLALPVSRAQVVRARYLTSLAALALGLALPLATSAAAHALSPESVPAPGAETVAMTGLLGLGLAAGLAAFLPFVYHFGSPKGPIVFMSLLGLACLVIGAVSSADAVFELLLRGLNRALDHRETALRVAGAVLLGVAASLGFSGWTYGRRGAR